MIRDNYSSLNQSFAGAGNMRITSTPAPNSGHPTAGDVICGRGKKVFEHAGNVNFRAIVQAKLPDYKAAVSKAQKSAVVSSVFDEVALDGSFIKQNPQTEEWFVVTESAAREKISQCFRDCLHDKFDASKDSSSNIKKRKQTRETANDNKTTTKTTSDTEDECCSPMPKRTKLFRSRTAPASVPVTSSRDAFQQLVMFSNSVMPADSPRRSNSLGTATTLPSISASWLQGCGAADDFEPLPMMEPLPFPTMMNPADFEPTPLPFLRNANLAFPPFPQNEPSQEL